MTDQSSALPLRLGDHQFAESIGYLIVRASSSLWSMVSQRTMAELGITAAQGSILFMVAGGKCQLAAELARECGTDASAVTRLIDRLEKRGLLKRVRSNEDRRAVPLVLTQEGQAIAARMPAIFIGVRDRHLTGFSPEEDGSLKSMLRRLLVNSSGLTNSIHHADVEKQTTLGQ